MTSNEAYTLAIQINERGGRYNATPYAPFTERNCALIWLQESGGDLGGDSCIAPIVTVARYLSLMEQGNPRIARDPILEETLRLWQEKETGQET